MGADVIPLRVDQEPKQVHTPKDSVELLLDKMLDELILEQKGKAHD